jgi:hypothetical protein
MALWRLFGASKAQLATDLVTFSLMMLAREYSPLTFWSSLMLCFQLNKNEAAAIDDHPYWGEVAERPNVLLLGDSLTDMQVCYK